MVSLHPQSPCVGSNKQYGAGGEAGVAEQPWRGQGTEALSIVLIFDGASSGSTRAQWVELAPFLEIVAW